MEKKEEINEINDIEEKIEKDEMDEMFNNLDEFIEQTEKKDKYKKLYSSFDNFPADIKKNIYMNIGIIIGIFFLFFICAFKLHYISALLIITCIAIVLFLGIKTIMTIRYLKTANFISFTGKIVESYPIGSKITNDSHYIIKLLSDDGKELCFRYFGKKTLMFDQYITIFIRENSEITTSDYGPLIETYIEAVPTDEIESRMKLYEIKKDLDSDKISVENYLNEKR